MSATSVNEVHVRCKSLPASPRKGRKGITMSDSISRADAIEAVLTYFIPRSHTGERGEHEEDFVRTIFKALPPAEAEWIPCSERLPKSGRYLASCLSPVFSPQVLNYDEDDGKWFYDGCKSIDFELLTVIAWMPLPEPYKVTGETEK